MASRRTTMFAAAASGAVLLAIVAGVLIVRPGRTALPAWRTAAVDRGDIVATVSASGTLNAVTTVQVGSQLSGQIMELLADFNTPVTKGQVLARLDPATFASRVSQAQAELETARANVALQKAAIERANADLANAQSAIEAAAAQTEKARATLVDARRELGRKQELLRRNVAAQRDVDKADTDFQTATASLHAAEAQESQARSALVGARASQTMSEAQVQTAQATVRQYEAALNAAAIDLDRTVIRAPIDGIVLNRSVDLGQTVAASLQSPTLFLIAEDLTKMQVETSIDEADIGRVEPGQRAIFTVDALPGREFAGEVSQIRKSPQTVQNVVTYTVVIATRNDDQKLLPGLTANVRVVVDERHNAMRVPNTALRFRPPAGLDAAAPAGAPASGGETNGTAAAFDPDQASERLAKALSLNPDQQRDVRNLLAEALQRARTLRQQGLSGTELQQALASARQATANQIKALLEPEQRKRYDELNARRRARKTAATRTERLWLAGADGKPEAATVQVGITDGTYTEIVGGAFKDGSRVIVGVAPAPSSSQGSGLRLGL